MTTPPMAQPDHAAPAFSEVREHNALSMNQESILGEGA
jgi:hypothetical protein